jgi:hypothetical protein
MPFDKLLDSVLQRALAEVRQKSVPIYTFALYHDHESNAVSVCVDTEENSAKCVASTNRYNMKYFMKAIAEKDLKAASLWQANIGRSLSLGDFTLVNAARTDLGKAKTTAAFYLSMIEALVRVQGEVIALSPNPERLAFASSGPDDEVAYVWSAQSAA